VFSRLPLPERAWPESTPPGAEAKTSLGAGCKTPCSVSVAPADNTFSVTYTLNRFQPSTVQVSVIRNPGDYTNPGTTTIDPNPVFAELQPAAPVRGHKATTPKSVKKKRAAPDESADSPFSDPSVPPPPGTSR
jgi:hypothetical protein